MKIFDKFEKWCENVGILDNGNEKDLEKDEDENSKTDNTETKETSTAQVQYDAAEKPAAKKNILDFKIASSGAENNSGSSSLKSQYIQSEIKISKPKKFDDARAISSLLRNSNVVIVNFEEVSVDEATRIINFISGTIYAIDGDIRKIDDKVFICVPNNIKLASTDEDKKNISFNNF